jgi:hypothetical protein
MPRSFFRWRRFSLRSLLIAVTALAVWLGVQNNLAKRQRKTVVDISNMGGVVVYDFETGEESAIVKHFPSFAGNDLVCSVSEVRFYGSNVQDDDLEP